MKRPLLAAALALSACTTTTPEPQGQAQAPIAASVDVSHDSVRPGTSVSRGGQAMKLARGKLDVDKPVPATPVYDVNWKAYKFAADGKVKVVSIVPSVDTKVCELQTHLLGETDKLDPKVERVTLSRDLPAAQKRFAEEAKLTNVTYLSDYRDGSFGKATGLLIEDNGLLARAVMVVDGQGRVRYLQVVPDVTKLPDMEKAFAEANKLVK